MSILIEGMEMPTSCPCELLGIGYDLCCSFAGGIPARVKEYYECCQNGTRPSWCPLFHVPSHGRLIDADALIEAMARMVPWAIADPTANAFLDGLSAAYEAIQTAPTIIEAEEGET